VKQRKRRKPRVNPVVMRLRAILKRNTSDGFLLSPAGIVFDVEALVRDCERGNFRVGLRSKNI
jgi:hypothetical protein